MSDLFTKHPKTASAMAVLSGLTALSAVAGGGSRPPDGPFPSGLPERIRRELLADTEADPDPAGQTMLMTGTEAEAISASPGGHTALETCRARRSMMLGYVHDWDRMSEAQRNAVAATAVSWDPAAADRCAGVFDEANGYPVATRKAKVREAEAELRQAIVDAARPKPVSEPPRHLASSGDCQWWRDEIERDDREAALASTRDLRDDWDHNRLQAQNAYRDFCR